MTLYKKIKFSIKGFISKCEQTRRKLRICLLKKSSKENFCNASYLLMYSVMYNLDFLRFRESKDKKYVLCY